MLKDTKLIKERLGHVAATLSERLTEVDDGVRLRVLDWQPAEPVDDTIIVFVPGWVSVIDGWLELLRALIAERRVLYVESREKRSAAIERARLSAGDFTIERLARDLVAACDDLAVATDRTVYMGSSVGSTSVIEALKHGRLRGLGAFLIAPNSEFAFPRYAYPLMHLPLPAYRLVKDIALFHLRHFRVNEPGQMERYQRTLTEAVPLRMKLSAQAFSRYRIWQDLDTIGVPVGIAHAVSDTLHTESDIKRLTAKIPGGRSFVCPSNTYMHSPAIIAKVAPFIAELRQPASP